MISKKFKVTSRESGMTLLAFLRDSYPDAPSVKALKRWIEGKRCTINSRLETFSTHRLKSGDEVILDIDDKKPLSILKPVLLWENPSLKAYDKPAGLVSHPDHFKGHLVHRLDKETSGVILVAKSQQILDQMIELFRQKKVQKSYLAIVDGIIKEKKGIMISSLSPKHQYQGQTLYGSSKKGQLAETHWKKIGEGEKSTLVQCHPITGRTHQLRVHFKEFHHPILGDYQYTSQFQCLYKALRHLLHAYEITFRHPISQEKIEVRAPIPLDFSKALHILGMNHLCQLLLCQT
jgi:23S rRNA-/tRNA-specific pseudouridylate synthase